MKSLLWFLGLSVIMLSIVWMVGALKAGLFVRNAQGLASPVDEHSIEPFSREKKFVENLLQSPLVPFRPQLPPAWTDSDSASAPTCRQ